MPARFYVRVERGTARVQLLSESGRELLLYRLHPGQSCVLTTSCLLASDLYPAEGIAEDALDVSLLSAVRFRALFAESAAFRTLVLEHYAERLSDLLRVVSGVAFAGLDRRLAQMLLTRADEHGGVLATHAALARELGVHRESISRQLKRLEGYGLIRLGRARVDILDRARLAGIARLGDRSH